MKEKIMYLILEILIGALITAGCFLVFAKGAKQPMDGKMGERLDFENMTEEEKEEMLEKRGNEGVNGENRKRPTNDVESEPNTQDTSTTSDTNNSTQNS